jgi:hypothetical protein
MEYTVPTARFASSRDGEHVANLARGDILTATDSVVH